MPPESHVDYWGTALTTLKFLGILVSGAGAIVGTTPEKPPKKTAKAPDSSVWGKLSSTIFSKRWAFRWLVIGLFISFLSQALETKKNNDEAKESREKELTAQTNTSKQITLAQKSLVGIERVVTRFDNISVKFLSYELPHTNLLVRRLRSFCDQCINGDEDLGIFKNFSGGAGFYESPPDAHGDTNRYACDITALLDAITNGAPHAKELRFLLRSFMVPRVDFGFSKTEKTEQPLSSLLSGGTNGLMLKPWHNLEFRHNASVTNAHLFYGLPSGRLVLVWPSLAFPRSTWVTDGEITSVYDLNNAYCYLHIHGPNLGITNDLVTCYQEMQPTLAIFSLDNYGVTFTSFDRVGDNSQLTQTKFPPKEAILSGERLIMANP